MNGTHIQPAMGRLTLPPATRVIAIGTASCATAAPDVAAGGVQAQGPALFAGG